MHIITIAFACSQIQYKITTILLYLFSEHASFFLISSVDCFFAEISKQMRRSESDPVCLCDSGAKIIPLGNARVGKVKKWSTSNLNEKECHFKGTFCFKCFEGFGLRFTSLIHFSWVYCYISTSKLNVRHHWSNDYIHTVPSKCQVLPEYHYLTAHLISTKTSFSTSPMK